MNRQSTTVHPHRLVKAFAALSLAIVAAACSAAGSSKGVSSSTSTSSVVAKSGVTAQLDALKLINYLPEDSPHDTMWTNWNPAVLSTDFARIRSLHANTVRVTVFPPHAYYGYPQPTTVMLQRLHQLVQIASDTGIRVQLALFDSFTTWSDIAGSEQWARSVLQGYANDKEIAFVDIHNELDPDDPQQVAWAKTMLPFVKSIVGSVLVTVSKDDYLGPDAFCRLTRELAPVTPDFWDWHFYGVEGLAAGFFERVKACAAPLPLYLGEIGVATYPDSFINELPNSTAAYDAYQEYYFRVIADAARRLDLPPIGPWILTDLNSSGAAPDEILRYYYFGLFRSDGTPKPAAAFVSSYFAGKPISQSFNSNFEQSVTTPSGLLPALWRIWDAGDGSLAWDDSVGHSSAASLKVSNTDANGSGMWVVPVNAHVVPRQVVNASVWAKGENSAGYNLLSLSFFDSTGVYCGAVESKTLASGSRGWTQLTATGKAPRCANYVRLYLKSFSNTGDVWFDDVKYSAEPAPPG